MENYSLVKDFVSPFVYLAGSGAFVVWIGKQFFRPQVTINATKETILQATKADRFYSLVVHNSGRGSAEMCTGSITFNLVEKIHIVRENDIVDNENLPTGESKLRQLDSLVTRDNFRRITEESLCWATKGNPQEIVIHRGMSCNLELFKVHKARGDSYYLIVPSEYGWQKVRARIWVYDGMKGNVSVFSKNSKPCKVSFEIRHKIGEIPQVKLFSC